jgi:hypothetical protein
MNKSEREINQNSINLPIFGFKTHIGSVTDDNTSTSVETSTKFECKQEPCDDIQCVKSNKSDISHTGSSEILDQEELEEILKTIEKETETSTPDPLLTVF